MKKTLLLFSALLMSCSLAWAQEKGTPAAENKKADENSTEKVADKVPDTYANDFTYTPYTPTFKSDGSNGKVKNVILLIGDGMGMAQAVSGYYANGNDLAILKLKRLGFVRTYSASHFTTDSAASGTTYACGVKTTNGFVGMTSDEKPAANIPEKLSPKGIAMGVISTDNISGATPSVFYAHVAKRGATADILSQLPLSKLDLFAAGCESLWEKYAPEQVAELKKAGFTVLNDYNQIQDNLSAARIGVIAKDADVQPVMNGRGDFLPATVRQAIEFLNGKSKKGFFLMAEGAQIDWGCHNNDVKYTVTEVIDFDKAVSEALKFADQDGQTLVIITADHETGGMTIPNGDYDQNKVRALYTVGGHTGVMVPLYAYGPHSQDFQGVQENTDVHKKIVELLEKGK